jgi:formate hydrogenlyase transcriptional activator
LLRVLQEQEFEHLGSTRTIKVDVRLVAATNRDLALMVADGRFRADLYYRLNVFPIALPPLRERREDIPPLVRHFTQRFARRMGRRIEAIPAAIMDALASYSWPGNVRELQNVIERAVILSPGPALQVPLGDLQSAVRQAPEPTAAAVTLAEAEREHILGALPGDRLGGGRREGGSGPPGDEALDLAGENEKTRNLPTPVVPARRQLYRPGGTSYLALPVLAANRLDPSDPQILPNACLMKRSAKVHHTGTARAFRGSR